jgi:hypothetical protein
MPLHKIEELQKAVRKLHGCDATWIATVPVREEWQGKTAWRGVVQVFELSGHNRAKRCYVWNYEDGGRSHYTTVLELPPVTDAESAVRISIAAKARQRKPTQHGK